MGAAAAQTTGGAPTRRMGWPRTFGHLARGRNINPETLLATDYLNHFNEIVMLIDMAGDMPDVIEDIAAWAPATYAEHFARSGFADKELAVLAYENAPAAHRAPFDAVIEQADRVALRAGGELARAHAAGDTGLGAIAARHAETLRRLVSMASGIINGHGARIGQREIDAILAE